MRLSRALAATTASTVLVLGLAACGDDDAVSDEERQQATEAALEATGGQSVTDVDKGDGDDGYAYSVEVQGPEGQDIEVQMDEDFTVTNDPPRVDGGGDASPSSEPSGEPSAAPSADATPTVDADDQPLTGDTLRRASAAAIEAAGGGRVTDSGTSDDPDHAYEVEVRLDNGEDVDVELDEQFNVTDVDR